MRRTSKANFYRLRKSLNLTIRRLYLATGIPQGDIADFEKGHMKINGGIKRALKHMEDLRDEQKKMDI